MRPPEAQRRSAAARARPKTPSIDSERRAAIAKSQVVSRTLVAGAYFEVSYWRRQVRGEGSLSPLPVVLTPRETKEVAGGLNPQPLPPGYKLPPVYRLSANLD